MNPEGQACDICSDRVHFALLLRELFQKLHMHLSARDKSNVFALIDLSFCKQCNLDDKFWERRPQGALSEGLHLYEVHLCRGHFTVVCSLVLAGKDCFARVGVRLC